MALFTDKNSFSKLEYSTLSPCPVVSGLEIQLIFSRPSPFVVGLLQGPHLNHLFARWVVCQNLGYGGVNEQIASLRLFNALSHSSVQRTLLGAETLVKLFSTAALSENWGTYQLTKPIKLLIFLFVVGTRKDWMASTFSIWAFQIQ